MRPSLRFLALAVFGWAGVRAAMVGSLPGADFFRVDPARANPPPIVPTQFPTIEPVEPATPLVPDTVAPDAQALALPQNPPAVRYVAATVGVPIAMRPGVVTVYQLPPAHAASAPDLPPRRSAAYVPAQRYDEWPLPTLAAVSMPVGASGLAERQSRPAEPPAPLPPLRPRIDRLQLTTWALLRSQQTGIAGSRSLATGGQLGASQAGARLIYNVDRRIALTARLSSEVGRRGGEAAAGVRIQPLLNIPVWLTAERRQMIGRYGGGRNDFALFMEGGLYSMPLPWRFSLDTYVQGGVVGLKSRDLFVDGALTVTRPVFRQFSLGAGVWGGAQPGLYRVDVGPRLTMRVRQNLKVHVDWRQRVAGNARPGSGPALTLASDF
jgi:hypothetical protein